MLDVRCLFEEFYICHAQVNVGIISFAEPTGSFFLLNNAAQHGSEIACCFASF